MKPLKKLYFAAGILMVILGIIGAFLPIMPTVPFLLAAAWFFDRSSPRFQKWLYEHPVFGPPIQNWKKHGSISIKAKCLALTGIISGFLLLIFIIKPIWWVSVSVFGVLGLVSLFIISRPNQ